MTTSPTLQLLILILAEIQANIPLISPFLLTINQCWWKKYQTVIIKKIWSHSSSPHWTFIFYKNLLKCFSVFFRHYHLVRLLLLIDQKCRKNKTMFTIKFSYYSWIVFFWKFDNYQLYGAQSCFFVFVGIFIWWACRHMSTQNDISAYWS